MAKLNSEDPLFDKDVVNLRTLNNALKRVEDSTLSKALEKFEDKNSNNLKVENDTLFIKNARLAEGGGVIFSGGTDLSNIFKRKDLEVIDSFVYDNENKITLNTEGKKLEITIEEFKNLSIIDNLNVNGVIKYNGENLEELFLSKEEFLENRENLEELFLSKEEFLENKENLEELFLSKEEFLEKEIETILLNSLSPSFYDFKELPNGINTDFTSEVFYGSEIVFMNGLMQRKDLDYEIIGDEDKFVRFAIAPPTEYLINIYGVKLSEPTQQVLKKETFKIVSSTEELIQISEEERAVGMLIYNLETETFFSLKNIEWNYDISDWKSLDIKEYKDDKLIFVDKELPEGQINGVNKVFFLNSIPKLNSEHIYLNGLLQDLEDYNIEENKITFNEAPLVNSKIRCSYRY